MDKNFWFLYQAILKKHKIPTKSADWYIRWIKSFDKTLPNVPLPERTKEDVQAYIDVLVRRNKYQDWQLEQVNDALHLLFCEYLELPWAKPWPVFINHTNSKDKPSKEGYCKNKIKYKDVPNWEGLEMRFPELLQRIRTWLRTLHYAYRTEQSYVEWICRFLNFSGLKAPEELGVNDVKAYLEYLAVEREVASSTQRQALNAIVFLYEKMLERPLGEIGPYERPKRPKRLPVVLTRDEKDRVLNEMKGIYALMAGLLYGSGLRLMECVRLRVKDVDFEKRQIIVRDAKGAKDRVTMLPERYSESLKEHLFKVKEQHEKALGPGLWESLFMAVLGAEIPRLCEGMGMAICISRKGLVG